VVCQRIFFPIGQGAFYSEKIDSIRTVYDCGVCFHDCGSNRVDRLIASAFKKREKIDLLFISHFDYDHVSKIPLLLEKYEVKRIVMPLLEEEDRVFLGRLFYLIGEAELGQLLSDPESFASTRGIHIIRVKPPFEKENHEEGNREENTEIIVEIDGLAQYSEIESLSKMRFKCLEEDWIWVPFNYESSKRSSALFTELSNIKLDSEKLVEAQYFDDHRQEIKAAYKSITGNINENSLFLYSGPAETRDSFGCYPWFFDCSMSMRPYVNLRGIFKKVGCVFTGDGDLNKVAISDVFCKYMKNVGTIQIPHHGSKSSYKQDVFNNFQVVCPISVGSNNSYGHPSGFVLSSLIERNSYPFLVTERVDSYLIFKF
jgi:hypothetical protein